MRLRLTQLHQGAFQFVALLLYLVLLLHHLCGTFPYRVLQLQVLLPDALGTVLQEGPHGQRCQQEVEQVSIPAQVEGEGHPELKVARLHYVSVGIYTACPQLVVAVAQLQQVQVQVRAPVAPPTVGGHSVAVECLLQRVFIVRPHGKFQVSALVFRIAEVHLRCIRRLLVAVGQVHPYHAEVASQPHLGRVGMYGMDVIVLEGLHAGSQVGLFPVFPRHLHSQTVFFRGPVPSGAVGIVQEDGESGAVFLQLEVLLSRSHAVHIAIHRQNPERVLLPVFHLNHVGQLAQQLILAVSVVSVHAAHLTGQHMLLVLHQDRQRVSVGYLVQTTPGIDIQSLCRSCHDVPLLRAVHVPAGLAYLRQLSERVSLLQEEPLQGTHHQRFRVHTFYGSHLALNAIRIRVSGQLMHPLNHEDTVRGSAPDVSPFLVPAQLAHVVAAQTVPGRERLQHLAVLQEHQSLVLQAVDIPSMEV